MTKASKKKVLIISYYWPPSGGAGVQRWLKFSKYLPAEGWIPVVYTPENPEIPSMDHSLATDIPAEAIIIQRPIHEPYGIYKKFVGQKKGEKINTGFLSESDKPKSRENLARWFRGNFFIPDARKFWISPSVRYLEKYLKQNPVDLIVSTGPPHSMHLIALGLKKRTGIPWLADFRDPWTRIDFYEELHLSERAHRKHRRLETAVLEGADQVVAVGDMVKEEFKELANIQNIETITNGYDDDDFAAKTLKPLDKKFTVAHIGSFSPARNPHVLWEVIRDLCKELPGFEDDFSLKLIGKIDISVRKDIDKYQLNHLLQIISYIPHSEVVIEQMSSQVLLLVVNNTKHAASIIPGKLFEYMRSRRPIMVLGPKNGDVAKIVTETKTGISCDHKDYSAVKKTLTNYYEKYRAGNLEVAGENVEYYSRKNLTTRMAVMFEKLTAK